MSDVIADGTGNKWTGIRDNGFLSFLGIPYGDAPVRFRRAKPYSGRDYVDVARAAEWYPSGCSSGWIESGEYDCLKYVVLSPTEDGADALNRLNIVVPAVQEELLPVMLYMHGGGLFTGVASKVTPMEMMRRAVEIDKKFIFVSFEYVQSPIPY